MLAIPKTISYKEIMLVYDLSKPAAKSKLSTIRAVLGKPRHAHILVPEFCKAENIAPEMFADVLQGEYAKLHKSIESKPK